MTVGQVSHFRIYKNNPGIPQSKMAAGDHIGIQPVLYFEIHTYMSTIIDVKLATNWAITDNDNEYPSVHW